MLQEFGLTTAKNPPVPISHDFWVRVPLENKSEEKMHFHYSINVKKEVVQVPHLTLFKTAMDYSWRKLHMCLAEEKKSRNVMSVGY